MRRWLLISALAACQTETVKPTPKPHIVLITLDTTRADRLGAYGYAGAQTETLDALAAAGKRFSQAYSPATLTIPAHISLFTGLYPPNHGVRGNGDGVLRKEHYTLMRALKAEGYTTGASVAAFVTTRKWGFHHGFDAFFDAVPQTENAWRGERKAEAVIDDALDWVSAVGTDQPLFLWTHLYDVHFPHEAPEPYASALAKKPYDAEVAYVDDQVARLVDRFAKQPTIFVIVGDHGEGLGDHGELGHGMFVYNATTQVPMIISGYGIAPEVIDSPVSLVDVLPTLLTQLGAPIPAGIDGQPAPHDTPVYMEAFMLEDRLGLAPHIGVVQGQTKFIDTPRPELYSLDEDPDELKNQSTHQPTALAELKAVLEGHEFPRRGNSEAFHLDPAVAEQLEALGYVAAPEPTDGTTIREDPKDHKDLIRWTQRSERLLQTGHLEEADLLLEKLLDRYPDLVRPVTRRITALAQLGRTDHALKLATEARKKHPEEGNIAVLQAKLLAKAKRWTEAAECYREAAVLMPWASHLKVRSVLSMLQAKGGAGAALTAAEAYLAQEPDNATLAGLVGLHYLRVRRIAEAMPLLAQGATADQPMAMINFHLGAKAHQDGHLDVARNHLETELRHHPSNLAAARLLKDVLVNRDDWPGMVALASRVLEAGPSAEWSRIKAQGLFNQGQFAACRRVLDGALSRHPQDPQLILLDANTLKKEGHENRSRRRFEQAKTLWAQKEGR
jgi:arylsulfatase A-like enzyme/predicted Zn-dependent protease